MHITKKALLAIVACFIVILIGYFFYAAKYQQRVLQTIQSKHQPESTVPETYPLGTSTAPSVPVVTKESLPLAIGQTGTFDTLSLKVNTLKGDSRCPVDVQCFRAGDVTVSVTLTDGAKSTTKNLTSLTPPYTFGSSTIAITEVTPIKKSKEEIKDTDYVFTFVVIRTK